MKNIFVFIGLIISLLILGFSPFVGAANYGNVNIINDSVMNNTASMSANQIQNFLNSFPGSCLGGNFTAPNPQGYSNGSYSYGNNVNAGTAIYNISTHYNLNPQVLIATLEKEQGLIDRNGNCNYNNPASAPSTYNGGAVSCGYNTTYADCSFACQNTPTGGCVAVATGYACPGFCKKSFNGFSPQLSGASWVFRFAEARAYGQLSGYSGFDNGDDSISYNGPMTAGYRQRVSGGSTIYYDGSYTDLDGNTMYISNGATASMLNYTPFYARSYSDDKLFHSFFTRWFGNPNSNSPLYNTMSSNQINTNAALHSGDYILSPDGKFVTVMQYDGNLVTYTRNMRPVWSSNTPGNYGSYAIFQNDGNFVIYLQNATPIWSSNTQNLGANGLYLGNDGNIKIYSNGTIDYSTNIKVNAFAKNGLGNQSASTTTLQSGDYINSPDGRYTMLMQGDGNLVVYSADSLPLWSSVTFGNPGAYAVMQGDGNLVVYNSSNRPLWSSRSFGQGTSTLKMQNDGNLVVYNSSNTPTWSSNTWQNSYRIDNLLGDSLFSGTILHPTDYLRSADWRYTLVMQNDGNLVLYSVNGNTPLWSSVTFGNPGAYAVMQGDGNLVVYNSSNRPLWSSRSFGQGTSTLKMQNDGNLVVYNSSNTPTWSSNTFGRF